MLIQKYWSCMVMLCNICIYIYLSIYIYIYVAVSINGGIPKWMVCNAIIMDDLGVPLFQETSILYIYIYIYIYGENDGNKE